MKISHFISLFRVANIFTLVFSSISFATFNDVDEQNPYAKSIEWMFQEKIVVGYEDGNFKPEKNVSRAEFLKIIYATKSLIGPKDTNFIFEIDDLNSGFSDISANDWFTPYIMFAKKRGTIKGYEDGKFKPHREISRAEALKIVLKEYFYTEPETWYAEINTKEKQIITGCQNQTYPISDLEKNGWYNFIVLFAHKSCLIPTNMLNESSSGFQFKPNLPITRGEVAEILYRTHNTIPKDKTILPDKVNEGNFASPNEDFYNHLEMDVKPWIIWGDSPDDTTTMDQRISVLAKTFWGRHGLEYLGYEY